MKEGEEAREPEEEKEEEDERTTRKESLLNVVHLLFFFSYAPGSFSFSTREKRRASWRRRRNEHGKDKSNSRASTTV